MQQQRTQYEYNDVHARQKVTGAYTFKMCRCTKHLPFSEKPSELTFYCNFYNQFIFRVLCLLNNISMAVDLFVS